MSRFKAYKGYALFINYKEDNNRDCRAEIYANSSLVETTEWARTEEKAFENGFKIIDNWYKQQEKGQKK